MTADRLWLPREILIAEETPLCDDPQMVRIFAASPWREGNLARTRVRYRNERGEVNRVVGSWAPSALVPLNVLADCDDERILGSLLETKHRRAAAVYSDESVSVVRATTEDAVIFELPEQGTYLILSCSLYCNALDEPLLCQCTTMTTGHRLFLRRAVDWNLEQLHGSTEGPDRFGGDW